MKILFFVIVIYLLQLLTATSTDSQPRQSQHPFYSQFDIQHDTSILDQIQVPTYVSAYFIDDLDKKQPRSTDHHITSKVSASVPLCENIGGEKLTTICSYLLTDHPWRQWRQKVSRCFYHVKIRHLPMAYNYVVKTLGHRTSNQLSVIQVKTNDWWNFPYLEWHILKSNLLGLWQQYGNCFADWFFGTNTRLSSYDYASIDGGGGYSSNNSDDELEPDQYGCYYDILGTKLCVDEQQLLGNNGFNSRVTELFDAMTYEERTYTLRFHQRFTQWATKASTLTEETLDRTQSIWLQHTQTIYQFLDDALSLDTCTNNNNNNNYGDSNHDNNNCKSDRHHHRHPTANEMNLCPPVIFPFSTSPVDISLEPAFFSLDNQHQALRSTTTTTKQTSRFQSSLIPIQQPWISCAPDMTDNTTKEYGDSGIPEVKNIHSRQQSLDPYNKKQYQYLRTRMEKAMTNQFERLDKMILQEYYRVMATAPHQWTLRYNDHQQRQSQQPHVGHASQQLYQELRLFISLSLRKLYKRSVQQLMDATERYDELVMKQVEHAYGDIKWMKKLQARRLFTFYPIHYDTSITNNGPELSTSSYPTDSAINPTTVKYIGQRTDWAIQTHRKYLLRQWNNIFEHMDQQSHLVWISAIDQARGRRRVWLPCDDGACLKFLNLIKIFFIWLFLIWA